MWPLFGWIWWIFEYEIIFQTIWIWESKPNKLYNLVCLQKVDVHGDDPKKVDGISVTLRDINLFTTGLFGCEASAEESFHTALVRKQMTVLGKSIF